MLRLLSALRAHVFKLQRKERWKRAMLKLSMATSHKVSKAKAAAGAGGASAGAAAGSGTADEWTPAGDGMPALEDASATRDGGAGVVTATSGSAEGAARAQPRQRRPADGGGTSAKEASDGLRPASGLPLVHVPSQGGEAKRGSWRTHNKRPASRVNAMLQGAAARTYVGDGASPPHVATLPGPAVTVCCACVAHQVWGRGLSAVPTAQAPIARRVRSAGLGESQCSSAGHRNSAGRD